MGFFSKLFSTKKSNNQKISTALYKTKKSFFDKITNLFSSNQQLDIDILEKLEEALYSLDINSEIVFKLIEKIEKSNIKNKNINDIILLIKQEIKEIFYKNEFYKTDRNSDYNQPIFITLIVGVNGVGKTTSVAKLANLFKKSNKKVLLSAADTFRAAAVEQLNQWSLKLNIPIIKKEQGADPSSVVFDTIKSAIAKKIEIVLIDTAGRLHNKTNLMEELVKIKRVIQKQIPDAPHEVLLVLDGTTGQNAINQAKEFLKYTNVTGLIVTKLDGSSKGGFIISIINQLNIPIKFIGVGEGLDDLIEFDPQDYINSLFDEDKII